MSGVDDCSCVSWFRSCTHELSSYDRFIYERFVSNFCCSSPPESSRCTSCGIQRSQPVIVDHLYMAIFVLNCSSSLTQEFLEGYRHVSLFSWFEQRFSPLTMNSNWMTIFKSPVVLIGSLNRADVDSLRFPGVDVVHNSDMLRWCHPLWWYSVHRIHIK